MNEVTPGLAFYESALNERFCLELFKESIDKFTSGEPCWSSNYFWRGPVFRDIPPWFIRDYVGAQKSAILQQLVASGVLTEADIDQELSVMNYVGPRTAYIPWHNDIPFDLGVTVYLNDYWPEEWGGLYLYREDANNNKVAGFLPKFNTALKNTSVGTLSQGVRHSVSPVSQVSTCPRVTIQIFPKR